MYRQCRPGVTSQGYWTHLYMLARLDQLPHERLQLVVSLDQTAQVGVQGLLQQTHTWRQRTNKLMEEWFGFSMQGKADSRGKMQRQQIFPFGFRSLHRPIKVATQPQAHIQTTTQLLKQEKIDPLWKRTTQKLKTQNMFLAADSGKKKGKEKRPLCWSLLLYSNDQELQCPSPSLSTYLWARLIPVIPVLPPHLALSEPLTEDPTLGEDVTGAATPLSTKPCTDPAERQIRHQKLSPVRARSSALS